VTEVIEALSIGGWPDNLSLTPADALDANADYLDMIVHVDVPESTEPGAIPTESDACLPVEAADGHWLAAEIKLGHQRVDEAAANLLALKEKLSPATNAACGALCVIVADSPTYTRPTASSSPRSLPSVHKKPR
jgi:hypothetical protein